MRSPVLDRLRPTIDRISGSIIFQIAAVLVLHHILFERLFRHCELRPQAYFQPVIAFEAVKVDAVVVLLLAPFLALFLARRHIGWRDIDPGRHTRWFVVAVAGILTWSFTTYGVNLFYDQSHWLDRLLLLALWVALLIHPMAIVPFLVFMMCLATQGHFPLPEGSWMWPDKRLPLDVLVLFTSYLLLAAGLRRRIKPMLLPFALLCLVGATYAHAAFNKVLLGPSWLTWVLHNDLSNLVVSSYLSGNWLRGLGEQGVLDLAGFVRAVGVPMAIGTLLAEGAGLLLLIRWRLTQLVLVGFVLLHLGILATSGIFFWKWIAVDLALLVYLRLLRRDAAASDDPVVMERPSVHRPLLIAVGFAVMVFAPRYFHNVPFAWFDTKLVNYFEIYGIGESDRSYRIDPRFFAPYELVVQQSRHFYAATGPVIVGTYGTTLNWRVAQALDEATPDTLEDVRRRFGRTGTSPRMAQMLFQFVHRYLTNAERRGGRSTALRLLAPPFHFQRAPFDNRYDFQEPLKAVEIRFLEYLHGEGAIEKTLDVRIVRFDLRRSATLPDQ